MAHLSEKPGRGTLFSSRVMRDHLARPVVLVDGGARGGLVSPLDRIEPELCSIVRLEPDADAEVIGAQGEHIVRKALWSTSGTIELHLTRQRACSSVYAAEQGLLSGFIDVLGAAGREVIDTATVEATTIDEALSESDLGPPDFIKLDVHGAEYEALAGASKALSSRTVGVLVECWPVAVHAGQPRFWQLDALLQESGFLLFQIEVGEWPRKPVVAEPYVSQMQSIQLEILYLLDGLARGAERFDAGRLTALVGFAELFGQVTYAVQVAQAAARCGVIAQSESETLAQAAISRNRVSRARLALSIGAERFRRAVAPLILPIAGR